VQLTLGVLTVVTQKNPAIATAHLAVGALVLGATLVLAIRLGRSARLEPASEVRDTGSPFLPQDPPPLALGS